MVSICPVDCPRTRVDRDAVHLGEPHFRDLHGHMGLGWKWGASGLVRNKLDSPEEATAADVTNVGVVAYSLPQELRKKASHFIDVLDEIFLLDDALDLEGGSTPDRMPLVCVSVDECAIWQSVLCSHSTETLLTPSPSRRHP